MKKSAKKPGPKAAKAPKAARTLKPVKPPKAAKSVAAKPTESSRRKGTLPVPTKRGRPGPKPKAVRAVRAAAVPRKTKAPAPIVKKVIQSIDAQALKTLAARVGELEQTVRAIRVTTTHVMDDGSMAVNVTDASGIAATA